MKALEQISLLQSTLAGPEKFPSFTDRLPSGSLTLSRMSTLQINLGKMCNQTCKHCHVDAGPTRREIMTRETMEQCLRALDQYPFEVIDLTGGAPEMNPDFRWLVEQCHQRQRQVLVRCNLTIIEAHQKYADLPEFFAKNQVQVISSLPSFDSAQTDRQRGTGVFAKSILALKRLNAVGYGQPGGLSLNLVYNPNGAFLPGAQEDLRAEFKTRLFNEFGIVFNQLFTITNMPISRFLDFLVLSGNLTSYMRKLNQKFNPQALDSVMCRSMLSVGWDGQLYDCDFNQMLEMPLREISHISQFSTEPLLQRKIRTGPHCYGCTAGNGSSCGGAVV